MFLNMCVQDVRRPEENVECPGLGVTGRCELPCMGAAN